MKNRTIYEVLDSVMENYTYTIEQTGNKIHLFGKVYIERIDVTVTHEKTFYKTDDVNSGYKLENGIKSFKEELRNKVADIIKSHAEELTDDEAMIDKLLYEVKRLTEELERTRKELELANHRISQLEFEKLVQPYQPYPWTTPNPASTGTTPWDNPNPWSTGITWETQIGDPPGWMDKNNITCDFSTSTSIFDENNVKADPGIGYDSRLKNPKRFG